MSLHFPITKKGKQLILGATLIGSLAFSFGTYDDYKTALHQDTITELNESLQREEQKDTRIVNQEKIIGILQDNNLRHYIGKEQARDSLQRLTSYLFDVQREQETNNALIEILSNTSFKYLDSIQTLKGQLAGAQRVHTGMSDALFVAQDDMRQLEKEIAALEGLEQYRNDYYHLLDSMQKFYHRNHPMKVKQKEMVALQAENEELAQERDSLFEATRDLFYGIEFHEHLLSELHRHYQVTEMLPGIKYPFRSRRDDPTRVIYTNIADDAKAVLRYAIALDNYQDSSRFALKNIEKETTYKYSEVEMLIIRNDTTMKLGVQLPQKDEKESKLYLSVEAPQKNGATQQFHLVDFNIDGNVRLYTQLRETSSNNEYSTRREEETYSRMNTDEDYQGMYETAFRTPYEFYLEWALDVLIDQYNTKMEDKQRKHLNSKKGKKY